MELTELQNFSVDEDDSPLELILFHCWGIPFLHLYWLVVPLSPR